MAMTNEKVLEAVATMADFLRSKGSAAKKCEKPTDIQEEYGHLLYMCNSIPIFLEEGQREKAMRWLGFMQGVLWSRGGFTLDRLKNMNKPNEG